MRWAFQLLGAMALIVCVASGGDVRAQSVPQLQTKINLTYELISRIDQVRKEFDTKERSVNERVRSFPNGYDANQLDQMEADVSKKGALFREYDQAIADYATRGNSILSELPELSSYRTKFSSTMESVHANRVNLAAINQQEVNFFPQLRAAYNSHDTNRWNALVDQLASLQKQANNIPVTYQQMEYARSIMSDAQAFLKRMLLSLQDDLARAQAAQNTPQPSPPQVTTPAQPPTEPPKVTVAPADPQPVLSKPTPPGLKIDAHGVSVLMSAVKEAAKTPACVGAGVCNFFVGKVAELAHVPYFNGILTDESSDGRNANKIYEFITTAGKSKPSGWKIVSGEEAQELANSGRFVIAVARNVHPSPVNHGHVALVAPSGQGQLEHSDDKTGSGPWIRDSENSTLSVRVSKRFGSTVVKPIYAV